jgi:DNA-directed RNA polymerase III subunit RPC3
MEIAETRFGSAAREVVHKLFLLGHTRISDLAKAFESKQKDHVNGDAEDYDATTNDTNGVNGQSTSPVTSEGHLHSVLQQLLDAGFLEPVVPSMFLSPADTYNKIEKEILRESFGGSTKGAKQKEELKLKVKHRLHDLRTKRAWKGKVKKRPLNGQHMNGINGTNKRRRLSNGDSAVSGDTPFEDDGTRLDDVGYSSCYKQEQI